jgi:hypothetical protein
MRCLNPPTQECPSFPPCQNGHSAKVAYLLNDNCIGFQGNPTFLDAYPLKVILDLPDVAHIYFKLLGHKTIIVNPTHCREVFNKAYVY